MVIWSLQVAIRGTVSLTDAKVFDACGKKFCGWYISPLDG